MANIAIEVIQNVTDVRVLGAASGVVAQAVVVGPAAALSDEDRSNLLQQLSNNPTVIGQLRRLLCFPGFVVRGNCNVGPSSTCGLSLEGCSFGVRLEGMLDGILLLLYWGSGGTYFDFASEAVSGTLFHRDTTTSLQSMRVKFLNSWIDAGFWSLLCRQLAVGGGGEISPVGCSLALSAMYISAQRSGERGKPCPEMLVIEEKRGSENHLRGCQRDEDDGSGNTNNDILPLEVLVRLLESDHLSKVFKWPVEFGGGAASHSPFMMTTPMGVQMEISQRLMQQKENERRLSTSSQDVKPFDWWSPGLVGVSGTLYRVILLAWSPIGENVSNEVQRMAQQVCPPPPFPIFFLPIFLFFLLILIVL
jgi:hypothetical protein